MLDCLFNCVRDSDSNTGDRLRFPGRFKCTVGSNSRRGSCSFHHHGREGVYERAVGYPLHRPNRAQTSRRRLTCAEQLHHDFGQNQLVIELRRDELKIGGETRLHSGD